MFTPCYFNTIILVINVTSSPFLMVLDAWATMRSPMKYLDMLLSQLWLRRVNLGYCQGQVTQLSILLGNLTIHYIPMSKSYQTSMYLWLRRANDGYSPLPMLWILVHQFKVKTNPQETSFKLGLGPVLKNWLLFFFHWVQQTFNHTVCVPLNKDFN